MFTPLCSVLPQYLHQRFACSVAFYQVRFYPSPLFHILLFCEDFVSVLLKIFWKSVQVSLNELAAEESLAAPTPIKNYAADSELISE